MANNYQYCGGCLNASTDHIRVDDNFYCERCYEVEFPDEQGCEDEPFESFDLSDDGDALASAGHGMDEDYCEGYDDACW